MIMHADPHTLSKEAPGDKGLTYIHSECCNMHWELVHDLITDKYELQCEKCGRQAKMVAVTLANSCSRHNDKAQF